MLVILPPEPDPTIFGRLHLDSDAWRHGASARDRSDGALEYPMTADDLPETRFARSGSVNIAYQVMGSARSTSF